MKQVLRVLMHNPLTAEEFFNTYGYEPNGNDDAWGWRSIAIIDDEQIAEAVKNRLNRELRDWEDWDGNVVFDIKPSRDWTDEQLVDIYLQIKALAGKCRQPGCQDSICAYIARYNDLIESYKAMSQAAPPYQKEDKKIQHDKSAMPQQNQSSTKQLENNYDYIIRLSEKLLEGAHNFTGGTTGLDYYLSCTHIQPIIEEIEKYLLAHSQIPFSAEIIKLFSPNQPYREFPESLKKAAFLLRKAAETNVQPASQENLSGTGVLVNKGVGDLGLQKLSGLDQVIVKEKQTLHKSHLLQNIHDAVKDLEKATASEFDFDNLTQSEMAIADEAVIKYLKERFGEQDDALGNWPSDWHECPEALELWKKTIRDLWISRSIKNVTAIKNTLEATSPIIPQSVAIANNAKLVDNKNPMLIKWITADLFDWDKPFTPQQIKEIENKIDPLAKNLEELAKFIETADDLIRDENMPECWYHGVVSDGLDGKGDYDVSGHSGYSENAKICVCVSVLSFKKLRTELEKIMGIDNTKEFYRQLQSGLRLVVSPKGVYLDAPSEPIPPERHNSAGSFLASQIRLQAKIAKPATEIIQTCTLQEFIENKCDLPKGSDGNYFRSKKELLNKSNRKKEITLPNLANEWKSGKPKVYRETDLSNNWYEYRKIIPSLPPLKNSISNKSDK